MKVEIYTKPDCIHCTTAKHALQSVLQERSGEYIEYDCSDEAVKASLKERLPGVQTVPQVWINDEYIGGADKTLEALGGRNW